MTQNVQFNLSGLGNFKGSFIVDGENFPVNLFTVRTQEQFKVGEFGTPAGANKTLEVGSYENTLLLTATSGSKAVGSITNNGHVIWSERVERSGARPPNPLVIKALEAVIPPPIEIPVDEPKEIFNICANVFRLRGSTSPDAPPQEKVLISSGCTFSKQQLETLESTGHIVEVVGSESELGLVGTEPIDTPESTFKRDKDGNKIFNVNLVERLVIRDDFN